MQEVVLVAYVKDAAAGTNARRRVLVNDDGGLIAQLLNGDGDPLDLTKGLATAEESLSVVLATDQTPLPYQEAQAPVYEDNTNGVAATVEEPIATNTYAPSLSTDFGTVTKANVKGSAGNVLAVHVHNANAAGRFFLIHNKSSAPVATDVPRVSLWVPPNSARTITFRGSGLYCSSGIGWSFGTTAGTFTDSATAAEHGVTVEYK
jgi:hypothetical protein